MCCALSLSAPFTLVASLLEGLIQLTVKGVILLLSFLAEILTGSALGLVVVLTARSAATRLLLLTSDPPSSSDIAGCEKDEKGRIESN